MADNRPGKDFAPTAETISAHGLGFIQIKLPANRRMHVWHPALPRRACFDHSQFHNHRFAFRSQVLIGRQVNQRADLVLHPPATHDVISHDGPRAASGGRESFVAGRVNVIRRAAEEYGPGESYLMPALEYHHTPNSGIVVTIMEKLVEGQIHACSVIERPHTFDQGFDRHQMSPAELWALVIEAFNHG